MEASPSAQDTIREITIQMLGRNAYDNQMQVDGDFSRLCMTVRYLVTQIGFAAKMEPDDAKEHVDSVLKASIELLLPENLHP